MSRESIGARIVTDGLVLALDAANPKSYPGTGTTWTDLSGNGYTNTLSNGPTYNSGNGGSISFDGINDRTTNSGLQTFGNNTTWCIWINRTASVNSYNMFMGRFLPYFGFRSNNVMHFSNNIGGSQRSVYSTSFSGTNNTWYFLAFTTAYNGTSTTMSIYINGNFNSSATYTGAQVNYGTSYNFSLGDGRDTATWYPFNGKIANCTIFNQTLSASEIQHNFNATRSRFGI